MATTVGNVPVNPNTTPTIRVPRESVEYVPLPVQIMDDSNVVVTNAAISYAILPVTRRPLVTDWLPIVADPAGGSGFGCMVPAVTVPGLYGVWIRVADNPETVVMEPGNVGWLART